jgi:transglutaminase-like putative cysteine protease
MKLRIQHLTEYRYLSEVSKSSNDLRLTPLKTPAQKPLFVLLRVIPPSRLVKFRDFHGNLVSHFEIEEPHRHLLIESQATVLTLPQSDTDSPFEVPIDSLEPHRGQEEFRPFLSPSALVQIPPELWRCAIDLATDPQNCGVLELALGIMRRVYESCRYVPGVTKITTSSADFFASREGVCQDFSHLMIALCRAVQLPARYISGYLYDAKRSDIRGAHATHAWVEVWVPGHGWLALDPTNNCRVSETYVTVAIGRDYLDAAPITGSYWGDSGCMMKVSVHIEQV